MQLKSSKKRNMCKLVCFRKETFDKDNFYKTQLNVKFCLYFDL